MKITETLKWRAEAWYHLTVWQIRRTYSMRRIRDIYELAVEAFADLIGVFVGVLAMFVMPLFAPIFYLFRVWSVDHAMYLKCKEKAAKNNVPLFKVQ